jgi:hypothetical protein
MLVLKMLRKSAISKKNREGKLGTTHVERFVPAGLMCDLAILFFFFEEVHKSLIIINNSIKEV